MKAQSSFVWTDGAVHPDAKAAVGLDLSLIVNPGHPKDDGEFGSLCNLGFFSGFILIGQETSLLFSEDQLWATPGKIQSISYKRLAAIEAVVPKCS